MGRGVLEQIQASQEQDGERLSQLINECLGHITSAHIAKDETFQNGVKNCVMSAIRLSNRIAMEQGLFDCEVIRPNTSFTAETMEAFGRRTADKVSFCMFPLFSKRDYGEGGWIKIYLRKAVVI